MNFDTALVPVNKTAARCLIPGEHYERECNSKNVFDVPILNKVPVPKGMVNYIHHKQGRIKVLYYAGKKKQVRKLCSKNKAGAGTHLWMCKCDCGKYTVRRTKSLQKAPENDQCDFCKIRKFK